MPAPFSPDLDDLRSAVESSLRQFLAERRRDLPEAGLLVDEMVRLLSAGGKRLRPAFCYWGYRAGGESHSEAIVRAAAALELLHTFAIVHDDIMDAADERRGESTVHAVHGLEVALLVGDLALVLADALFVTAGFEPDVVAAGFGHYSRMRQEVIAGQFMDVAAARRPEISEPEARRIAVLKSGRYTIQEPLLIGAALAGAGDGLLDALGHFGGPLGEAFQLRDDLLGTFGERASTGKPVDSDIREGKRNVLFAKALSRLTGAERDFFVANWGRGPELSGVEVERLRGLVGSSGAGKATERLLGELADEASAALASSPMNGEARAALQELARRAVHRDL